MKGGCGSNGGTGGEAKKGLFGNYISEGGHGGDGGNGGSGITAEKVFINVSTGKPLKAAGGEGGSGGALASTAVQILNAYFTSVDEAKAVVGENMLIQ